MTTRDATETIRATADNREEEGTSLASVIRMYSQNKNTLAQRNIMEDPLERIVMPTLPNPKQKNK